MNEQQECVPNHHAHYPAFAGASGFLAALSMATGRDSDAELVVRLSQLGPDDVVVDIGCGPGAAVRYAAKIASTVTGVDPAPVMLRVARLRSRARRNVTYVEGSAEAVPVADAAATVVWAIATIHHWDDIDAALREVQRLLRPGGRFVAIERRTEVGAHGLGSHGWTDAQAQAFADRCRAHDFTDIRVDTATNGRRATVSVTATVAAIV